MRQRRFSIAGRVAGLLGLLAPSVLPAQAPAPSYRWGVGLMGGLAVPTGSYSSSDSPGGSALMYFSYAPFSAFAFGLDVGGTWTPHKTTGHTELSEVLVGGVWHLGSRARMLRPLLLANIGTVAVGTGNPDQGRLAFGGGAGMSLGRGTTRGFATAQFIEVRASGGALDFVRLTLGMRFLWSSGT